MRAVIQRVSRASVKVEEEVCGSIELGLLILLAVEESDGDADIDWLAGKIARLRVFDDHQGVMNLPLADVHGETLVVSQFTLFASTRKGNRPSHIRSAPPEYAEKMYELFVERLEHETGKRPQTGRFGAHMDVELVNDGPVTIIIDSKLRE